MTLLVAWYESRYYLLESRLPNLCQQASGTSHETSSNPNPCERSRWVLATWQMHGSWVEMFVELRNGKRHIMTVLQTHHSFRQVTEYFSTGRNQVMQSIQVRQAVSRAPLYHCTVWEWCWTPSSGSPTSFAYSCCSKLCAQLNWLNPLSPITIQGPTQPVVN